MIAVRLGAPRLAHGRPPTRACPQRGAKCRVEGRKVRTPQGSAPGNARSGQPEGLVAQKIYRLSTRGRLSPTASLEAGPTQRSWACPERAGRASGPRVEG